MQSKMGLKILVCVKDSISLKDESFRQFQIPVFSSCIVYPYIPIPLLSSTFFYFQIVCPYIYYIIIKLKLLSIEWLHPGIYNTKDLISGNICLLISQIFFLNYLDKTNFLPFIFQHFMEFLCLLNTYISAHLRISYIS